MIEIFHETYFEQNVKQRVLFKYLDLLMKKFFGDESPESEAIVQFKNSILLSEFVHMKIQE